MGDMAAAPGSEATAPRALSGLVPYVAGAVVGAVAGLLGVYLGQLAASVNVSLSKGGAAGGSAGWGALASSGIFVVVIIFGTVLITVGSEIGEMTGRCAAAVGGGVAVGLSAGAAGGLEAGAALGAVGGLVGGYLGSSNVVTLVRRELGAYFYSPIAYMVIVGFLVLSGLAFSSTYSSGGGPQVAEMRGLLRWMSFLNVFVIPLLTMRLLAEENHSGTIEVLMTSPVTDLEVVLGKYIGSILFYVVMLVPTAFYVWWLFYLSAEGGPDMGAIWSGYLGLILTAGLFLGGGLLVSSFCSDQIVAAVLAFVLVLGFFFVGMLYPKLQGSPGLQKAIEFATINTHFTSFEKGLIDSRDLGYFLSIITFFLFATVKSVESRKWR